MTTLTTASHDALAAAEHCARTVTAALLRGDAEQAETASRELQQMAQNVMHLLGTSQARVLMRGDHDLRHRLTQLVQQVGMQREAAIRRGGATERALQVLVPTMRDTTYAAGSAAASAYGRAARQTGAFRKLAA